MISMFEKKKRMCWLCVFVIGAVIFSVSGLTFEVGGKGSGYNVKPILYHVIIFFFFSIFLMMALIKGNEKRFLLLGFVMAVFYSVSDEIHQLFVPGRDGSIKDVLLDSVGILFAFVIYLTRLKIKAEKL